MAQEFRRCGSCGALLPETAKYCRQCGKPAKKPTINPTTFWIVIGVLVAICIVPAMFTPTPPRPAEHISAEPAPTARPSNGTGEYGLLDSGEDDGCLIATSPDALDKMLTFETAKNVEALTAMFEAGLIGYATKGTTCLVVDRRLGIRQVRILDGDYKGQTVWVPYEWVKPQ